jgi:hypothetical protein
MVRDGGSRPTALPRPGAAIGRVVSAMSSGAGVGVSTRVDATVVETNIRRPTATTLLADGVQAWP